MAPTGKPSIWPASLPTSIRPAARASENAYIRGIAAGADAADERRIRGIGECRAKAAARMRRALAWLDEHGACPYGFRRALRCMSPEHAIEEATGGDLCWLWEALGCPTDECFGCMDGFDAAALFTSPEWAAIPWQREPEVSRG